MAEARGNGGAQASGQEEDQLNRQLMKAAGAGNAEAVGSLLRKGADAAWQDEADGRSPLMAAAAAGSVLAVQRLLDAGAPWNAFDRRGRCAGEHALEAGHQEAADALLQAGVRAELLLGALERRAGRAEERAASSSYLSQRLEYSEDSAVLMDAEAKAVMMAWEAPLMEAHAAAICSRGGAVLNVGFGLGIIDEAIQRIAAREDTTGARVTSHTIIEAHPDVHARMLEQGWDKRPGVRVVFGRWQDVIADLGPFDGAFYDTYSEFGEDLREFHSHLPRLLKRDGLYSYFNGLAADSPFFHAVCCEVTRLELAALGFATQFVPLPINVSDPAVWRGVENKYWQLDTYYLPAVEWAD